MSEEEGIQDTGFENHAPNSRNLWLHSKEAHALQRRRSRPSCLAPRARGRAMIVLSDMPSHARSGTAFMVLPLWSAEAEERARSAAAAAAAVI